ncbi:Receptor-like protein kinase FERONIA [Morella rubra]|uniref:Receptor-like protein kinase FERONIA n=1 Tax=Morella rubra TaxID=262757 RepID=A0A6A1VX55_9ROSI|nr:Receptor-like protein kinase FERONIA [Morella rubra]
MAAGSVPLSCFLWTLGMLSKAVMLVLFNGSESHSVRLHFCEFQPEITDVSQRVFLIFIANENAEPAADVIRWSRGNAGGGAAGFVMMSILGFLIFWRGKNMKETGSGAGSTWWGPFSFSTTKSMKTHVRHLA